MTTHLDWLPGRALRVPALAVAALLLVSGCAAAPSGEGSASEGTQPPAASAEATPAPSEAATVAPAPETQPPAGAGGVEVMPEGIEPTAVSIPAIDVEGTLIDLGIAADGKMEVPVDFDEIG
ncbi:hypothetical protein [Pseudoclavibacter helvolus]|uniref:hypothetical protein n=1 Tax=Pseudoclavibacter helvolus TaxID=255205 RepID=UPI000ACCDD1F|nr:hypothetical protein [Pseudoclavibacter helvolus]